MYFYYGSYPLIITMTRLFEYGFENQLSNNSFELFILSVWIVSGGKKLLGRYCSIIVFYVIARRILMGV